METAAITNSARAPVLEALRVNVIVGRARARLSQDELAQRANVSRQTVSHIERAATDVGVEVVDRIARARSSPRLTKPRAGPPASKSSDSVGQGGRRYRVEFHPQVAKTIVAHGGIGADVFRPSIRNWWTISNATRSVIRKSKET